MQKENGMKDMAGNSKCAECGKPYRPGTKFCMFCGAKIMPKAIVSEPKVQEQPAQETCPQCGKTYKAGAKFCKYCGFKLADVTPAVAISKESSEEARRKAEAEELARREEEERRKTAVQVDLGEEKAPQIVSVVGEEKMPPASLVLKNVPYSIDSNPFVIGRESGDLLVPVDYISYEHAKIEYMDASFYVKDLNSTNHTMVNGIRLEPEEMKKIVDGDVITLGKLNFVFRIG